MVSGKGCWVFIRFWFGLVLGKSSFLHGGMKMGCSWVPVC